MPAKQTPAKPAPRAKAPKPDNHYHEDFKLWISNEAVTDKIRALLKDPFFHDLMFYVSEHERPSPNELFNAPAETVARKAVAHAAVSQVIPVIKDFISRGPRTPVGDPWNHIKPQP